MKLYHVSYENLGSSVTLHPRVPENRAPSEPERPPRVCVSTRVGDCLRLTPWRDGSHKFHVYVTEVKHVARASWDLPRKYVPDYKRWGRQEVWLLNKKGYEFKWFGYVRMFRMNMLVGGGFWFFKRGGEDYLTWGEDPTRIVDPGSQRGFVDLEVKRHLEVRAAIRDWKVKKNKPVKVHLARYADDVAMKDQVERGEKPYRVPLNKSSCVQVSS